MSDIQFLGINENFPVAGQDNDTQVFRDNFDTIKQSLRTAQTEVEDLQDNTAKTNQANDFNNNRIQRATLQNTAFAKFNAGSVTATPTTIDYENGNYQIYTVGADVGFDLLNFPGDPLLDFSQAGFGKVTLELYSDGDTRTVTFITSGGTVIKKDPNFPANITVSSSEDPVIIEIWRYNSEVIYMHYLGVFS